MKLIIIRHGETTWNSKGKIQGLVDTRLSKKGKQQALLLGKRFSKTHIDVIYTSKLYRSIKTAKAIAENHSHVPVVSLKALNEIDWGIWEGLNFDQIKKKFPKEYAARKEDKFNVAPPKGESPSDLRKRLTPFLKKTYSEHKDQTVLIVGHAGVNRVLIGTILEWPDKKTAETSFKNTSVTILHIKKGKSRLHLFNCIKHLEGTIYDKPVHMRNSPMYKNRSAPSKNFKPQSSKKKSF